jgi:GMP synthase PP-ATPase subunit
MKNLTIFLLFIFTICIIATKLPAEENTIEYQLAIFNAKGFVKKEDPSVYNFRFILNKLQTKFIDSDIVIANVSAKMYDTLKSEVKINESFVQFIEGLYDINHKEKKISAIDCIAGYTYLRSEFLNHNDAIKKMHKTIDKGSCDPTK